VWSLDLNPEQDLIFTGSGEGEVKAWRIDSEALAAGLKETETGEVHLPHPSTVNLFS
jgi:U3 small nucleolar RNA-associated protein 12